MTIQNKGCQFLKNPLYPSFFWFIVKHYCVADQVAHSWEDQQCIKTRKEDQENYPEDSKPQIHEKIKLRQKTKAYYESDDYEDENENEKDEDFKPVLNKYFNEKINPAPVISSNNPGICNKCGKECRSSGALVIHLKYCNPAQLKEMPEKHADRNKVVMIIFELLVCLCFYSRFNKNHNDLI